MPSKKEAAKRALGKYADDLSEEELDEFGNDDGGFSRTWTVTVYEDGTEYLYEAKSKMQACERAWEKAGMSKDRERKRDGRLKTNLPWDRGLYAKLFIGKKPFVELNGRKVYRAEPSEDDPLGENLVLE